MNPNKLLGVNTGASKGEIQQAYRKAAKEYHPDINQSPEANEAFIRIREARDTLLKEAENIEAQSSRVAQASDAAQRATSSAIFTQPQSTQHFQYPSSSPHVPTSKEIKEEQALDHAAMQSMRRSLFRRRPVPPRVADHRNKIKTRNNRIIGKY